MEIIAYEKKYSSSVAVFFRKIFTELGWEERASDYMDEPHRLFHLPEKGILLLVLDKGNIIGTAGVIFHSKIEGLIKRFYIEKSYRGSGIAFLLLQKLIQKARKVGLNKLILDVNKKNLRAIRFYEKNNFLPTQVTPREGWPESFTPQEYLYFYRIIGRI